MDGNVRRVGGCRADFVAAGARVSEIAGLRRKASSVVTRIDLCGSPPADR